MDHNVCSKAKTVGLYAAILAFTLVSFISYAHALDEVEKFVTASDGTKIPWGIKDGYEQSDATGKNLDPIMYYGHKPEIDKATALEIEKAWWYQIRGQYACNAYGFHGGNVGGFDVGALITKTNKRGLRRDSATKRSIMQWPKKKGLDYRDYVAFMTPDDMRGIATLIWFYTDFNKDYDQWLWVPALRKVRKLGAMDGEDSFGGMDIDYDDMSLRDPFQDSYKLLRIDVVDDKFIAEQREIMSDSKDRDGITEYFKKEAYGHKMWVVESFPKQHKLAYNKRVIWFEQNVWRQVKSLWFDKKGRKVKVVYRSWAPSPFYNTDQEHTFEHLIYAKNLLTGHHTEMNVLKIQFNHPENVEEVFTLRTLMRSRW